MQRIARILSWSAAMLFTGAAFAQPLAPLLGPAIGARCESIPLVSPDNRCAVRYTHTGFRGPNAQTAVTINCSWDNGFFQQELLRMSTADLTLRMRWTDATHLEVGLPADGRFPPLPKVSTQYGHTINYDYPLATTTDTPTLECLDPPEDFRNFQQLSGPIERPAHKPTWAAFGGKQTCGLPGNPAPSYRLHG
jgi:hypothetical protein